MGINYDHWLEHDFLDRDFWVEHYNTFAEAWKTSEEAGVMALSKAMAVLNNKNPDKAENILTAQSDEPTIRKKTTRYSFVCDCSYYLILISFALAIVSVSVGYICSNL